jgi:hypothetical protein
MCEGFLIKTSEAIVFIFLALTFIAGCIPACSGVDVVEATEAIDQADLSVNTAFAAVADAYDAGAGVQGLLEKLEVASDFLSEAHIAFRSGDYQTAYSLALKCEDSVEDLNTEAELLMVSVYAEKNNLKIWTVVGSCIGLILLIVLGIIGWRFLKEHYYGRVFEMKPTIGES